jgi:hypothetical protein
LEAGGEECLVASLERHLLVLTASSRDQREAELSIFWSYIVAMQPT